MNDNMKTCLTIGINEFVLRQTKESPYGYYDGSFEDIIHQVKNNFHEAKISQQRDGITRVILVPVCSFGYYTSTFIPTELTKLEASLSRRSPDEDPFIRIIAPGKKQPANFVDIVLYSRAALNENSENTTDCDWEVVSINASYVENEPMHPLTMARNFLEKVGGTKADYTAEEFAKAIWYWKDKVLSK